jgi:hypothetical protein
MTMVRSAEASAREAQLAELKQLITSRHYETLEKLEEAVEAFLWGEEEAESLALASCTKPDSRPAAISPVSPVCQSMAVSAACRPLNPR